jgi:recombination protein RecT
MSINGNGNQGVQTPGGKIVKAKDAVQSIQDMLEANKAQLSMALPKHVTAERLIRVAVTSLRKTPELVKCTPQSLISCIFQAAQLGLEVDNGLGHAYLVPFKGSVTLVVGYKGMVDLARRSGQVSTIKAVVVRVGDHFLHEEGLHPKLEHRPLKGDVSRAVEYVYAVCQLRDGSAQFEVMHVDEVEYIRGKSPAAKSGPWVNHWEEMAKKTVIRRLFKMLPVSVEMVRAVSVDEQAESGTGQSFDAPTEEFAAMLVSETPANAVDANVQIDPATGEVRQAAQ